ncbi:MAG: radical SAM protein [Myxococcaceae bacterium]
MLPRPIRNPPNPWASTAIEYLEEIPVARVELFEDHSRAIINKNDSADLPFSFTVNPYRGCNHGCAYCYARRYHEFLGFGAGSDFDTRIVVKRRAGELLRAAFERPGWTGAPLSFSSATDCYQPLEASLRLTRACLEVCAEYRNPVGIITKAPLVERDLDLLQTLTREATVHVSLSIPVADPELACAIEPGVATPRRRVKTIERLTRAGVEVALVVAPFIPGLSEDGLSGLLESAHAAGAVSASFGLVRLPSPVKEVFEQRLREALPLRAEKVLHRIAEAQANKTGEYASALAATFEATVRRLGFPGRSTPWKATFQRPPKVTAQLSMF